LGLLVNSSEIDRSSFIGRTLGNVTLIREIGHGVMGIVFVGYQKTLRRQVAVKVLIKSNDKSEFAKELFRDEGEIVAVLSHPNIVPIFEMGEADDCFYQIMQLVNGTDLRTVLRQLSRHPVPYKRIMPLNDAIDLIDTKNNVKDAIINCYLALLYSVKKYTKKVKDPSLTCREFEPVLLSLDLAFEDIEVLTYSFEKAKYSNKTILEMEKEKVLASLKNCIIKLKMDYKIDKN